MKNIIVLLSILLLATFGLQAQDVTISSKLKADNTYVVSNTVTELIGTVDSIAYDFNLNKPYPVQYISKVYVDTVAGSDTTLTYKVFGKEFYLDDWVQLSTAQTSEIATATTFKAKDIDSPTWKMAADSTYTITSGYANYYRYLRILVIRDGEDYTGGGVTVTEVELVVRERLY